MRLNLSKSGVGVSAGVRGARISTGRRGTYLHLGRGGLSYRARLDGRARTALSPIATEMPEPETPAWTGDPDIVREINARASRPAFAPFVLIGMVLLAVLAASSPRTSVLGWPVLLGGLGLWWWTRVQDTRRRTSVLVYDLDDVEARRFETARSACALLHDAQRVWVMTSSLATDDWKRNAGAGNLVGRRVARVGPLRLAHVDANVAVEGIEAGKLRLAFLPDALFVHDGRTFAATPYDRLDVVASTADFREGDPVPGDAQVTGHTWLYVRRDGGPDRRFANNRQIPIALYGTLALVGPDGAPFTVYLSRPAVAERFAAAMAALRDDAVAARSAPPMLLREPAARPRRSNPPPDVVAAPAPAAPPGKPIRIGDELAPSRPAPSGHSSDRAVSPLAPASVDWADRSAGIAEPCAACGRRVLMTVGDVLDKRAVACGRCNAPMDVARLRRSAPAAASEPPPLFGPVVTPPQSSAIHRSRWAWFCGQCGARNAAGEHLCAACGTIGATAASGPCPACDAVLPTGARYCRGCGRPTTS